MTSNTEKYSKGTGNMVLITGARIIGIATIVAAAIAGAVVICAMTPDGCSNFTFEVGSKGLSLHADTSQRGSKWSEESTVQTMNRGELVPLHAALCVL